MYVREQFTEHFYPLADENIPQIRCIKIFFPSGCISIVTGGRYKLCVSVRNHHSLRRKIKWNYSTRLSFRYLLFRAATAAGQAPVACRSARRTPALPRAARRQPELPVAIVMRCRYPLTPPHRATRYPLAVTGALLCSRLCCAPHCATGDKSDKRTYHDARECASLTETIMS